MADPDPKAPLQELSLSETHFKRVLEENSDGVVIVDIKGSIVFVNLLAQRLLGGRVGRLGETLDLPIVPGETTEIDVVHGVDLVTAELRAISTTWRSQPAHLLLLRDVTARKKHERNLLQAEVRFRCLVQHSADIITLLEPDGAIRFQSAAVESILGYRPEDLLAKNVFDYVHPGDLPEVKAKVAEALKGSITTAVAKLRFRHRDGSWVYLEALGKNLLHDPQIQGFIINSRNLSGRF